MTLKQGIYTISQTVSPQLKILFILMDTADTSGIYLTPSEDCTLDEGAVAGTINANEQQTRILTNAVYIFVPTVPYRIRPFLPKLFLFVVCSLIIVLFVVIKYLH